MSTGHQKYSTQNQADAIRRYAAERGFEIVRTYADDGKSGLNLDGREALQRLIRDVETGNTDFEHILVYDVSRWGRFQNPEQAAYLEYVCTHAGQRVHFCAEQFDNDGSLSATILKSVKTAMAREYSRELSTKVFAGQCRLITLGFRQGGMAGYGLRRLLVDEHRTPKTELTIGQQKSLQTDRVILVPGPDAEVQTVRRIYRLFVERRLNEREIAAVLNAEGILTDLGRPWTRGTTHQVLSNEKYVGNNLFNRTSYKLKQQRIRNPPDKLVRAEGAFQAIVDEELFRKAAAIIAARGRRYSNDEMLDGLNELLHDVGLLSALVIDEREDLPSSSAYRSRFGSLLRAYELIGYSPGRDYQYVETNRFLRSLYPGLIAQIIDDIEGLGASVRRNPLNDLLTINDEFSASVVISRCLRTGAGSLRWKIRFDTSLKPDITLAVRMASDNRTVLDYYMLPHLDFARSDVRMAEENGLYLDAYRVDTLDVFTALAARAPIRRAA